MPMMGGGLFSGAAVIAGESLMGHVVYGATVGLVYGKIAAEPAPREHVHA
jgi:hypothetical protein